MEESKKSPLKQIAPWNENEELYFECTGCGACCTGSPGFVWVSEAEILAIADTLQISLEECVKRYIRKIGERFSLKELSPNYDCIFLKDKQCSIYHARPEQCRTFPFWPAVLASKDAWEKTSQGCEGMSIKPLGSSK